MISRKMNLESMDESKKYRVGAYSARYVPKTGEKGIPKYEFPEDGMSPRAAYQLVHDEQSLDGNPFLNLASFVNTWMEPEADKLVMENISKNIIDVFEYPQTSRVIHHNIVNMLGRLFNGHRTDFVGTSTAGSSEAIMLGLLAHKWNWKKSERGTDKPNIIFGNDAHVCWDKFARYFDVDARKVPIDKDRRTITAEAVAERIDENTICVGCVLGTTFTGEIDPVKDINDLLLEYEKEKGWDIPIHIDAASGGFILPFTEPNFEWDFRLERVKSINVSGHKYGLTYPGLGWLIFRNKNALPEDLIFHVNYLGEMEDSYTLNFSGGSAMVAAQYYNFLRFGRAGYTGIMKKILDVSQDLAKKVDSLGRFEMLNKGERLPIIAFRQKEETGYSLLQLSHKLRERGWIVPAYCLPENAADIEIMRIVVRENFTPDMATIIVEDLEKACQFLENGTESGIEKPCPSEKGMAHIC
ncbi:MULTISPECIES: glutamate decarboxylase [unclassified Methanosarcina]|uniref:glutamate decarboxylase n=1 Tax=unclassified Methanosarcina TaxID=2644672 RepID=UPI000615509F|nr:MULTISPECIES: glutamate decarboxylase [unclassified Methanosarcina]AKB18368.1 Glutamate decarboxylase [Methanosarcina sp. WWM596]AKB22089.1 Glutamate decarboxylase [Methanosarcina sp. WH1]